MADPRRRKKVRPPRSRITLSRDLGLFSTTMIGIGGMIGAGIFALTGIAAGLAGPALILVFLLNGLLTLPTAMAYAELAATMPRAGGGYVWVNESLGGVHGFLCGWMSWFAYIAAGSLYALAFARFAAASWSAAGLPDFGLGPQAISHIWTLAIVLFFTLVNAMGAREMAFAGNFVTTSKLAILGLFVLFGLVFMAHHGAPAFRPGHDLLPGGVSGVLLAMGLTYIAFEGFEIIAQSGEEVMQPRLTIPRAIFLAMGITVTLYVLVAGVALGAVRPPPGQAAHVYLAQARELAIVDVARQIFPRGSGGFLMLVSGLAATASALNAAAYSASRVAFAMGRTRHLPPAFARIQAEHGTPVVAVAVTGALMLLLAAAFPLEAAATTGSIMFLLVFVQVNYAVIMRRYGGLPGGTHGYCMPAVPYLPLAAIVINLGLAAFMYALHPIAWGVALAWVVVGMLAYFLHFAARAAEVLPREVLFEEVKESRAYTVLTPVADARSAAPLVALGALFARAGKGELAILNVICVPRPLALSHGHVLLERREAMLDKVDEAASPYRVPRHRIIRLGRDVAESVRKTALELHADLLLLGWPGYTKTRGRMLGTVIDPLLNFPPCDLAIVHPRRLGKPEHVLVAVNETANCHLAVRLARRLAAATGARLTLLHVARSREEFERRQERFWVPFREDVGDVRAVMRMEVHRSVASALLDAQKEADILFLGATRQPLWKRVVLGSIPKRVAKKAGHTCVIVRRGEPGVARVLGRLLRRIS